MPSTKHNTTPDQPGTPQSVNSAPSTPVAYDYDAQKWVEGSEAIALLVKQDRETREVLDGPRGAEFAAFVAKPIRIDRVDYMRSVAITQRLPLRNRKAC